MPLTAPTVFFPGYELLASGATAPSQGIFIPLTTLGGLNATEANTTTGDGRKVCYEVVKNVQSRLAALATGDRPVRMSVSVATPTGVSATVIRQSYTIAFDLDVTSVDVASEV